MMLVTFGTVTTIAFAPVDCVASSTVEESPFQTCGGKKVTPGMTSGASRAVQAIALDPTTLQHDPRASVAGGDDLDVQRHVGREAAEGVEAAAVGLDAKRGTISATGYLR